MGSQDVVGGTGTPLPSQQMWDDLLTLKVPSSSASVDSIPGKHRGDAHTRGLSPWAVADLMDSE